MPAKTPTKSLQQWQKGLKALQKERRRPFTTPYPRADREARLRQSFERNRPWFHAGLATASPTSRALWERAEAFVDAGLPAGQRDAAEQAAFQAATSCCVTYVTLEPGDFISRWLEAGGYAHAVEVATHRPFIASAGAYGKPHALIEESLPVTRGEFDGFDELEWLQVPLAALTPAEKQRERDAVEPLAATLPPLALASLAIGFQDAAWARLAAIGLEAGTDALDHLLRLEMPIGLLDLLADGPRFAWYLTRNWHRFSYDVGPFLARAIGRLPDVDVATAMLGALEASDVEPRHQDGVQILNRSLKAIYCIRDPRLRAFFESHADHPRYQKAAEIYLALHP